MHQHQTHLVSLHVMRERACRVKDSTADTRSVYCTCHVMTV